jgi:hypothetical protein
MERAATMDDELVHEISMTGARFPDGDRAGAGQTTGSSAQRPKTPAKVPTISPTVA